jgi:hypothetical protein
MPKLPRVIDTFVTDAAPWRLRGSISTAPGSREDTGDNLNDA